MNQQTPPVDPARFNNPLALKTAWTPNEYSGFRLRTHRLVRVDPYRLEFRTCLKMYVIGAGMILAGLFIMGVQIGMVMFGPGSFNFGVLLALFFGAIFVFFGILVLIIGTKPISFDSRAGCFWHGRTPPDPGAQGATTPQHVPLNRIKAIQLLAESCSHKGGSFLSYELNAVLDDASRRTIIDHGILKQVREDAATLAAFIGVPVWDATK